MAYRLPPLAALRAFESAARFLSFKEAARELNVTPAAISQQIKALEGYLGLPLFRRLPRGLTLTDQATAMLPKLREGFECLAAAVESTRHHAPGDGLTVSAPPSFATRWLVPRLSRFTGMHPDIELSLSSSLTTIDRDGDGVARPAELIDLRDQLAEVAIRFGSGRYPGQRVDLIFSAGFTPACSPHLLTGKRPLRTPADLCWYALIHDQTVPDGADRPSWKAWLQFAGVAHLDSTRGPRFGNAGLALEAALAGQGVVLALKPLIEADIAAGRLVTPFDITVPSRYAYYLTIPEALADRPAVAAFRNWLMLEAKTSR